MLAPWSGDGRAEQAETDQESPGECFGQVGQRPPQDGEEDVISHIPCTQVKDCKL